MFLKSVALHIKQRKEVRRNRMNIHLKQYLDEAVARINTPSFIDNDPVQFLHRYLHLQDIEIVAFTVATITWGRRPLILRDALRMLDKMGSSPYDYVMNEGYRNLGTANVHRTFFEQDLNYMLRGFNRIYAAHPSLETFLQISVIDRSEAPAWDLCRALRSEMILANDDTCNAKCFPARFEASALKRINLALRWLVRNDGIVDLGVWTLLKPSQLCIPLDVHVGRTARTLGLLIRKNDDRKAAEQLTAALRHFCPEDPVKYDFALFGIGMER
jgi:uncharacterized protein (TIGR02757 family)